MPGQKFWINNKNKKLIWNKGKGKLIVCELCPCCEPKVIASTITNRNDGRAEWNLKPYQNVKGLAAPGAYWRIRDVGEAHHDDNGKPCSGIIYNTGRVDKDGILTGLPDKFVSSYSYNGYMELQIGCRDENGSIKWPCPNG